MVLNKIYEILRKPSNVIRVLGNKGFFNWLDDSSYLKVLYWSFFYKSLDLDNPQTFNEKLQWLKINDRNPKYTQLVDKYEVREHIKNTIGEDYLIPLLGVWNSVEEIDWDSLPNQFVLKTTHGSGGVIVCKDKSKIDLESTNKYLSKSLSRNYYPGTREWPYKNVKPRIIAEEFTVDESETELKDYKIMCFNGEPKIIQVMSDRSDQGFNINHYDINWNPIEIQRENYVENPLGIPKPNHLSKMIEISKVLAEDFPFVRIDLYNTGEKIFFGEVTFYPVSGHVDFSDTDSDLNLGSWIGLSK